MMKHSVLFTSIILSSVLIGCNSKDDSVNSHSSTSDTVANQYLQTGIFVDAPIANIQYKTDSLQGTTTTNGEYQYLEGEQVTFYIGELELPSVLAKKTVTPLDMSETKNISDHKVTNIIRLLQTLDKDGNPDNGIEIPNAAATVAQALNFDLSTDEFENLDALNNLIINANPGRVVSKMVSKESAEKHFSEQLEKFGVKSVKRNKRIPLNYADEYIAESNYYVVEKNTQKSCSLSGWTITRFFFSSDGNYTIKYCDNSITSGNYQIIDEQLALEKNGLLTFKKRLNYDETTFSFESCITDPSNNEKNCLNEQRSYEFTNLVDARVFVKNQEKISLQSTPLYFVDTNNTECTSSNINFLSFEQDSYTYNYCDGNTETGDYSILDNNIIQLRSRSNEQTSYLKLSTKNAPFNTYFYCGNHDLNYTKSCITDSDTTYKSMNDALQSN